MPLFAVDVAPYVLPPLTPDEVLNGTAESQKTRKANLNYEIQRVKSWRKTLKRKRVAHLDVYQDSFEEILREEDLKLKEKGRKQRELLGKHHQYLVATSGGNYVCVYITCEASACKFSQCLR